MMFWVKVQYIGITSLPVLWIGFTTRYTGYVRRFAWFSLAVLSVIPVASLLLNWTDDLHHLYYARVAVDSSGPFPMLVVTPGPWYWVCVAYLYLLFFAGTVLAARFFVRAPGLYRTQAGVILAATMAPWLGNMLYMAGLRPLRHLDLTPFTFTVTIVAIAWGVFRSRFLDVVPVARDKVVESIGDAIFVLDRKSRLVDVNPAGQRLIGRSNGESIGLSLDEALAGWPDLRHHVYTAETDTQIISPDNQRIYNMRVFPLHGLRDEIEGRLVVLHDITEHIRAEQAMRQAKEAAEASNRAKSVFLSNLSHEFRTPLNIILGFGQLMVNDSNLTPHQREGVEMINSSGEQLLGLINGLLEMIKDEAAHFETQAQALDRLFDERATHQQRDELFTASTRSIETGVLDVSLRRLPPALLENLEEAAIRIDMEAISQLIDEIGAHNPVVAAMLTELARDFRYDEIVVLCRRVSWKISAQKRRK